MRITDIQVHAFPISRYADTTLPSGGLTTSIVAVATDVRRGDRPVVGYGYSSVGRFGQSGLITERFAPRLLNAADGVLADSAGTNLDPFRAWETMMAGEKLGGHGERSVAVGTLDMAIWDAAAKIAGQPLYRFLADRVGREVSDTPRVRVYAGGGYHYPQNDIALLSDEMRRFVDLGFTHAKMKIGGSDLDQDLRRIDRAAVRLPRADHLAVDAMNSYDAESSRRAVSRLAPLGLWWFEDICDPLDFVTQAEAAGCYGPPIAAGEALFSLAEAKLLMLYGGVRSDRDVLVFDPVHCYGLPEYLRIVMHFEAAGWPRRAFWPHGGHLFGLHIVAALGLGGAEVNPLAFHPFRGLTDETRIVGGLANLPGEPGIGFELNQNVWRAFQSAFGDR